MCVWGVSWGIFWGIVRGNACGVAHSLWLAWACFPSTGPSLALPLPLAQFTLWTLTTIVGTDWMQWLGPWISYEGHMDVIQMTYSCLAMAKNGTWIKCWILRNAHVTSMIHGYHTNDVWISWWQAAVISIMNFHRHYGVTCKAAPALFCKDRLRIWPLLHQSWCAISVVSTLNPCQYGFIKTMIQRVTWSRIMFQCFLEEDRYDK